jgi:bla regulator protein blaR1
MNILATTGLSSSLWGAIGPPFGNHLWQSTLFAGAAGLLTLTLRKNQAQTRYLLWLAASVKFLIPFSLLIGIGRLMGSSKPAASRGFVIVLQEVGQPFASAQPSQGAAAALDAAIHLLPTALMAIWACGFIAVLLLWLSRWRGMVKAMPEALPANSGREHEMLRRLEQSGAKAGKIKLIISESALEPGIVGIFRPVMFLPAGISGRLTDSQLEAIVRHELCHVRRRDNLAALVHMLVEAVFWFHPLIWWIGARLIDERERACDEEVLRLGSDPEVYAEGILKVCEFYLESPLVCAAGVTGSNLKKRIEAIMTHRIASKLNFGRKLLLAVMGAAAIAGPVILGMADPAISQAQSQQTSAVPARFESVSIKAKGAATGAVRSRIEQHKETLTFENQSLRQLVKFAYQLQDSEIAGGPDWMNTELYDVDTKMNQPISNEQYRLELQKLLADRFKLAVHRESRELPGYELVVGKGGAKLTPAADNEGKRPMMLIQPVGHLEASGAKIAHLIEFLEGQTGRTVIDRTGLNGAYDYKLISPGLKVMPSGETEGAAPLIQALSEQLGLELNPVTAPVNTLVIDHAESITGQP